jgi:hypothetical protein
MTSAELDRMWERGARKIVSIEIINGSAPQAHGAFDPTPKVIATLVDGSKVELFSYRADERSFRPAEFVGLTVDEGRRLRYAAERPRT